MAIEINNQKFYDPTETSEKLSVSRVMLRYYRSENKIEGIKIGNTWYHTEEQIEAGRKAIAQKGKRGPKKKGGNDPSICV